MNDHHPSRIHKLWRILMESDRQNGHWFWVLLSALCILGLAALVWFATP